MNELRCRFLGVVAGDEAGNGTGEAEIGDVAGSVAGGDGFTGGDSNGSGEVGGTLFGFF